MAMKVLEVSEALLDSRGIRHSDVPSLEIDGLKFRWLTTLPKSLKEEILKKEVRRRCRELHQQGRAVLLVNRSNFTLTVWQGPVGSADPHAEESAEPAAILQDDKAPQGLPGGVVAGPSGSTTGETEASPAPIILEKQASPASESQLAVSPSQPRTVTIKYRGRTITKVIGPAPIQQPKLENPSRGARKYRGRQY